MANRCFAVYELSWDTETHNWKDGSMVVKQVYSTVERAEQALNVLVECMRKDTESFSGVSYYKDASSIYPKLTYFACSDKATCSSVELFNTYHMMSIKYIA